MRKNVFRMIAQSICIGAIGLLAGTSLDYAYSGYGMLNSPNLWAESTTTSSETETTLRYDGRTCKCRIEDEYAKDADGFWALCPSRIAEMTQSRCNANGEDDLCTPEFDWTPCYVVYTTFGGVEKKTSCSSN